MSLYIVLELDDHDLNMDALGQALAKAKIKCRMSHWVNHVDIKPGGTDIKDPWYGEVVFPSKDLEFKRIWQG